MSKVKYYYDSESLSYRKIERKKRTTFKYASMFIIASAMFGFVFVFIASQYIESPKEKALKRELQNMQLQYSLLNKKMDDMLKQYYQILKIETITFIVFILKQTQYQKNNVKQDLEELIDIKI